MLTTTAAAARTEQTVRAPEGAETQLGWYLYGITRRAPLEALLAEVDAGVSAEAGGMRDHAAPLELLECSGLAAVVRPVLLADFSRPIMEERLRNASDVEAIVRAHNRVIEAIHARQPILPARFGMVYADPDDIVSAVRPVCDTLDARLHRLQDCDEWAVHVYADRALVRATVAKVDDTIRFLRAQGATARPGRAYFIERQVRDRLEFATSQALLTIAQRTFDRLARCALGGKLSPAGSAGDAAGELEILRAAFLVARDRAERFETEMRSTADAGDGLRCESSGPWPPYSFAAWEGEESE